MAETVELAETVKLSFPDYEQAKRTIYKQREDSITVS